MHKDSLMDFKTALQNRSWLNSYQFLARVFLQIVQNIYGKPWSRLSFYFGLIIAFLYPFLFFIWTYCFEEGIASFAGLEIFPNNLENRKHFFTVFLGGTLFLFYFTKFVLWLLNWSQYKSFISRFKPLLSRWFIHQKESEVASIICSSLFVLIIYFLFKSLIHNTFGGDYSGELLYGMYFFGSACGAACFHFIYALADSPIKADPKKVPIAKTLARYNGNARATAVDFFTITVSSGIPVLIVAMLFAGLYKDSLLILTLFFLIPLLNAFFDWVAWGCSRFFLKHASTIVFTDSATDITANYWQKISSSLVYIAINTLLATVFMIALCLLLPAILEPINNFYITRVNDAFVDWRTFALSAKNDPWGEGLIVTGMLFTTFIPTIFHMLLALTALLFRSPLGQLIQFCLIKYEHTKSRLTLFYAAVLVGLCLVLSVVLLYQIYYFLTAMFGLDVPSLLYSFVMYFFES